MPQPLKPAARTRSNVLRQLGELVDRSALSQAVIGERAGYSQADISKLRQCGNLRRPLTFYEDVATALGHELVLLPRRSRTDRPLRSWVYSIEEIP